MRLETQNAVFWQANRGQPRGQLAANRWAEPSDRQVAEMRG